MSKEINNTPCVSTEEPNLQARSNSGKRRAYCVMIKDYTGLTLEKLISRQNDQVKILGELEFAEITGQIDRQVYRLRKTDIAIDIMNLQREIKRRQP